MRHIQKDEEPARVKDWKIRFKNMNRRLPQYADIHGTEEKNVLKAALLSEQKYLCCYCCNRITFENSHIEHFRPKGKAMYEKLSLEYSNLHASCQGEKGDGKHCGHAKAEKFDEGLMISPLDARCEDRFMYTAHGDICAANGADEAAKYTIDTLALHDKRLCAAREEAIWASGALTTENPEEIQALITKFNTPVRGELAPFCDAILYQLRKELKGAV